jgi:hypothetical protein
VFLFRAISGEKSVKMIFYIQKYNMEIFILYGDLQNLKKEIIKNNPSSEKLKELYNYSLKYQEIINYLKNLVGDSENIIEKYNGDWENISSHQYLSESFMEKYKDKIIWDVAIKYQNFSPGFIEKHVEQFDINKLIMYQKLNDEIMEKIIKTCNIDKLKRYQNLSYCFKKKFDIKDDIKPPDPKNEIKQKKRYKKKSISSVIRNKVWKKYFSTLEAICPNCQNNSISAFNFEAGHIISEKNGGKTELDNLIPLCSQCNKSIGSKNLT